MKQIEKESEILRLETEIAQVKSQVSDYSPLFEKIEVARKMGELWGELRVARLALVEGEEILCSIKRTA